MLGAEKEFLNLVHISTLHSLDLNGHTDGPFISRYLSGLAASPFNSWSAHLLAHGFDACENCLRSFPAAISSKG